MDEAKRINPRKAHPNLYYAVTISALLCVALGLNFFFLRPAFNPLDIPKEYFGAIFLSLGLVKLYFLNRYKPKILRISMSVELGFLLFYGLLLVIQFFQLGQTSLQLPIMYLGVGLLELPLLLEPFINPVTSKENDNDLE